MRSRVELGQVAASSQRVPHPVLGPHGSRDRARLTTVRDSEVRCVEKNGDYLAYTASARAPSSCVGAVSGSRRNRSISARTGAVSPRKMARPARGPIFGVTPS